MSRRASLPVVAKRDSNPLMCLPEAERLRSLPPEAASALCAFLRGLARRADELAELSWRRRKAPMAAYWRAVAVYCRHITRVVGRSGRPARSQQNQGTET